MEHYFVHDLGNGNVRIIHRLPQGQKHDGFRFRKLTIAHAADPHQHGPDLQEQEVPLTGLLDLLDEQVRSVGFEYELEPQLIRNSDSVE